MDVAPQANTLFEVTDAPLSVDDLIRAVLTAADGAVVTFVGTVRDNHHARRVLALEYEAYSEMAEAEMRRIGIEMLRKHGLHGIAMRHRTPHFGHVFSGDGYSAGYYSYMWSEVLDADAFAAFEETGNVFDPATAKALQDHIYSAGGSRDPEELYKAFRGRLPTVDALLKKRGLWSGAAV